MDNLDVIMEMMEQYLNNDYDASDFAVDFAAEIFELEDEKLAELFTDMSQICALYEPDDAQSTNESELLNEMQFKEKVAEVYEKAKLYKSNNY